jgi:isocitrate dehydrogenase kinase/phosphatase
VIFKRARFGRVIDRQLDLFERDYADVIREAHERLAVYNAAESDEAEELYGDYVDAAETGTEILADIRDHFGRTLDADASERYEREFNRTVARRLPMFALEIENR